MDQNWISALQDAGFETTQTLQRFSGNEALYLRFLNKFTEDDTFSKLAPALMAGDFESTLIAAHTLKGVAGNLGLTRLWHACSQMVSLIRQGDTDAARRSYDELSDAYAQVCAAIEMTPRAV